MFSVRANSTSLPFFRRFLAGSLGVLVLALMVLSASPVEHEKLHHDAGHDGHECAVVIFAHGLTTTAAIDAPCAQTVDWPGETFARIEVIRLIAPRAAHPPQCGPPVL